MTSRILTNGETTSEETDAAASPSRATDAPSQGNELATDTLFELLQNQRRRAALVYLEANGGRTTLSDLAEHIAATENDVPIEQLNSKQRKRVYIGLYQSHLPKMADAGVVAFDKNRGTVELRDLAAQLYPYLDVDGEADEPEPAGSGDEPTRGTLVRSSVLGGVAAAALAGVAGVPGFAAVSPGGWAAVSALSLFVAAAAPVLRD
jgi:hypothetical protein